MYNDKELNKKKITMRKFKNIDFKISVDPKREKSGY